VSQTLSGATVSFDEIPLDWRVPATLLEIRADRRVVGLVPYPARTLIIAPKLLTGTGATLTPLRLTRADQARVWGGEGSVPADMAATFFANNFTGDVSLLLLDDPTSAGGAAKAVATITFSGSPTASGTGLVIIGGKRVSMPINAAETPTVLAARLVAAIAARADMSVTAANVAGVVTLTAKHFGIIGNALVARVNPFADTPLPAGMAVAVTAFAAGTGEADVALAISAVASQWWTDIIIPNASGTWNALLLPELERRWNAMVRLDAHLWQGWNNNFAALSTFGNSQNSRFMTTMGAAGSLSPPWVWGAALGAVATFQLTNDPARQLRGLPLAGVLAPAPVDRFIDTERDLLLRDGISTFTVTDDGIVVLERVITSYQRTSLGVEDVVWLDVMRPKVLSRIRYDWASYMTTTWPRAKLADDGSPAAEFDPNIATPRRLHASWAARLQLYERQGWVDDASGSAADSLFVRDVTDRNRVNARQRVKILGNLMTLAGVLEFSA